MLQIDYLNLWIYKNQMISNSFKRKQNCYKKNKSSNRVFIIKKMNKVYFIYE